MKRKYETTGDGECPFTDVCNNDQSDFCYVCMYNTSATPRDFLDTTEDLSEDERDKYIVS